MRKKRGCRGSGVVSGMADTDDNGGGELAPLGIIKKARLDRAQQSGETSRVRDVAETGKSRGQEIPPTLFKYAINGNGRHDLDYYSTDVLLVCQSLVCMARGSTSMRRSGRNTKSQGVQGPQERSSRWMRVLAACWPASPVRYRRVISARSKEARGRCAP